MSQTNFSRNSCGCLSFIMLFAGCANGRVDLGGGPLAQQDVQRGASCRNSTVAAGSVRVTKQSDLEDLAGCDEINGDLSVEIFAGADLTPLASLRIVDGLLELGAYPEVPSGPVDNALNDRILEQVSDTLRDGYLGSLAGLEGLERAGSLDITSISADNLQPLSGLRALDTLGIHSSKNLRDLSGLANVNAIQGLVLSDNAALESLGGISLSTQAGNIQLVNDPLLSSIEELAPITSLFSLVLDNVGVSDLSSLANLSYCQADLAIMDNLNLVSMDGVANADAVSLFVNRNAVLQSIPPLPNMRALESFTAVKNPRLQTIQLDLPKHVDGPNPSNLAPLLDPIKLLEIGYNTTLTHASLTQGLERGRLLDVYANPALVSLEIGSLTSLEELDINNNELLASVALGALQTVEALTIIGNSSLGTAQLRTLRTFESSLRFNADDPPASR